MQHTQQHNPGGIQTHNLNWITVADLRLRPRDRREQQISC